MAIIHPPLELKGMNRHTAMTQIRMEKKTSSFDVISVERGSVSEATLKEPT